MTPTTKQGSWERLRAQFQTALLAGIPEHLQRLSWNAEQLQAARQDRLRRLLAHAVTHSPFHRRRLAGVDLDRLEPADLSSLPVMTKADMMAALPEVFTDRRLTRDLVDQALSATDTQPVPILGHYLALASGGSTGQRGVVVLDPAAGVTYALSLTRPLLARVRALGGPPPGGLPVAMVAAASAVHITGAAPALTAGAGMPLRFLKVPVTLPLPQMVQRLNALQAPVLYGYPSMLARLAAEQRAGRLRIAPLAVTATGETLLPESRAVISEVFGAPVVDSFACTEGAGRRQRTRRRRAGVQHRPVHRGAGRHRQPARPTRRPLSQGAGDQPVQPDPAADPLRADRLLRPPARQRRPRPSPSPRARPRRRGAPLRDGRHPPPRHPIRHAPIHRDR
jgi:phenylacetate-CoA ligase